METQARKPLHPLVWIAGIALIVFCGAGAAALMGWIGTGKAVEQSPIAKLDKAPAAERRHAAAKIPVAVCLECGVVQSVQEVDTKGTGSGVGAVVGAVAGGLLGNEIEKQVKTTKTFEIAVRFDDGSNRVITEATASPWRVGDKVKVVNGVIHNNS